MSWMERRRERRMERRLTKGQLLGWANYLTYGRIATIPVFLLLLSFIAPANRSPTQWDIWLSWITTILFVLSALTDVVDGVIARRHGTTSVYGKFLDPLADKLFTTAILIMLIPLQRVSAWITVILICREILVTAVRAMAAAEDIVIAASVWGKRKTVLEHFALGALLIYYPFWGINPHLIGLVLIWITVIISLGSGGHYVYSFFREIFARHRTNVGATVESVVPPKTDRPES